MHTYSQENKNCDPFSAHGFRKLKKKKRKEEARQAKLKDRKSLKRPVQDSART